MRSLLALAVLFGGILGYAAALGYWALGAEGAVGFPAFLVASYFWVSWRRGS